MKNISAFPANSMPDNTWPDLTFPVLNVYIIVELPECRIYIVPYEDTTYPVPYGNTTYVVPFCQKK